MRRCVHTRRYERVRMRLNMYTCMCCKSFNDDLRRCHLMECDIVIATTCRISIAYVLCIFLNVAYCLVCVCVPFCVNVAFAHKLAERL